MVLLAKVLRTRDGDIVGEVVGDAVGFFVGRYQIKLLE
jgi:hypothetical protein